MCMCAAFKCDEIAANSASDTALCLLGADCELRFFVSAKRWQNSRQVKERTSAVVCGIE